MVEFGMSVGVLGWFFVGGALILGGLAEFLVLLLREGIGE